MWLPSSAICPSCSERLRHTHYPYIGVISCDACGWIYPLRLLRIRFLSAGLFLVLEFTFQVWWTKVRPFGPDLFALALPAVWPLIEFLKDAMILAVSFWAKHSPVGISQTPGAFAELIPSASESAGLLLSVLQLPRPRMVAWTWRAWINAAALVVLADISIAYAYDLMRTGKEGELVGLILLLHLVVFCLLVVGPLVLTHFSAGKVVKKGEATVGRVIVQIPGMHVFYAFVDDKNRPFVGRGNRWWGKFTTGEPVLVFYDPADPNWSAALPYSRYRLRQPGRKTEGLPRASQTG